MSTGQEPEEAGQLAGKQCAHTKKHLVWNPPSTSGSQGTTKV